MATAVEMGFQSEQLVEAVLGGHADQPPPEHLRRLIRQVHDFDCADMRVVVLGGGTGLSTVVGGNSQLAGWPAARRWALRLGGISLIALGLKLAADSH